MAEGAERCMIGGPREPQRVDTNTVTTLPDPVIRAVFPPGKGGQHIMLTSTYYGNDGVMQFTGLVELEDGTSRYVEGIIQGAV